MHLQTDGDIEVAPGERVRVVVTALNTPYLAIFGSLLQSQWTIVQPPFSDDGNPAQEVRTFVAPAGGREAFGLTCDFVRDREGQIRAGAQYVIEISGDGSIPRKRILPIPPFPVTRPFLFEIVSA